MDEQLIEKVKEHEVLYNHGSHNYRDQHIRQSAWEEIGKELNIFGNQAKERWENLRRCFCNARNRRRDEAKSGSAHKKKSSWKFEQQMSFLLPFLESRKTQDNLSVANLVAEPENLTVKSEAEDIVPSHIDTEIERDAQDDSALDFSFFSNKAAAIKKRYKAVNRINTPKQNTTSGGQLVETIKECAALRKRRYKEKETYQVESKPTSVLENLDDTDLFFLSMSKITKQLPKLEQSQLKLAISNSVLSAEIKYNQQLLFSTTPYSYSIQRPNSVPQQSYASTPSPGQSQEYSSNEY